MTDKKHESPGQLLAAAREARSLSVEDIAKQTRLSVEKVHDIEQDDYSQLGVRTFVRGYLCGYARLVGIAEMKILEVLDASGLIPAENCSASTGVVEGAPVMNVTHQRSGLPFSRWIAIAGGVLVLVALITWWQSPKNDTVKTAEMKAPALTLSPPIVMSATTDELPAVTTEPKAVTHKNHAHENKENKEKKKAENGFVIRPSTAMHTTYTVTKTT